MLAEPHRRTLDRARPPVIGVHVRQGDVRPLQPGEDFAKVGHVRAPAGCYRAVIEGVLVAAGFEAEVTLFSDGKDEDVGEILDLPSVRRAPVTADIVDLLLLSRSRVIIPAAGSSFSAWSAFLSDAAVLHDARHFHALSRPAVAGGPFEGPIDEDPARWPEALTSALRALHRPIR